MFPALVGSLSSKIVVQSPAGIAATCVAESPGAMCSAALSMFARMQIVRVGSVGGGCASVTTEAVLVGLVLVGLVLGGLVLLGLVVGLAVV